jgi:hypothetical protein
MASTHYPVERKQNRVEGDIALENGIGVNVAVVRDKRDFLY